MRKLRFLNATTGFCFQTATDASGEFLRVEGKTYDPATQEFYLEEAGKDTCRIRIASNDEATNGSIIHVTDEGKGKLTFQKETDDTAQLVQLVKNTDNDNYRIQHAHSGYYVHAQNEGTGVLVMQQEGDKVGQEIAIYKQVILQTPKSFWARIMDFIEFILELKTS